jgi:hypothetical protein
MDDFLKGTIGLSVVVVLAGIVGAAMSGSDRAFDLTPVLNRFRTAPVPQSDAAQMQLARSAGPTERLSVCPPGSINPDIPEVPFARAEALRQADPQFKDLIEVQEVLGQPHCNFIQDNTRRYRYLVESLKAIDATQMGDSQEVVVVFKHF